MNKPTPLSDDFPALSRRRFLETATASVAGAAMFTGPNLLLGQVKGANDRLRVGVMGLSRGKGHIKGYLDVPNVELAYVCDVDDVRLASGVKYANDRGAPKPPAGTTDFRKMLEDPNVDAISIATPNFWHAPATIMACRAGKHVYVEKPGSYNCDESRRMVEVAKETDRKVQMGTQRRSYPGMIEGIQKLREGVIGKLKYAKCEYLGARGSIGKGKQGPPPAELDWTMWQGPVPDAPYKDNLVHYNWHWHWLYGGGEMANNGVHSLDIGRWAMGFDFPERVTFNGGRYHFDDDQETPDTGTAIFDYGRENGGLSWVGSSCHRRKPQSTNFVTVYGEGGTMAFTSSNYSVFDLDGKEIGKNVEKASDIPHFTNFANAIRINEPLNQPIDDAQTGAMLCHYANIAYRTGGSVQVDSKTGNLVKGQVDAKKLWARTAYRAGFGI
ncbi:Gfo/Idh/MocA family oxidoreductase [Verrucomicrobiales bacterium]|nr:Gfo/Idh/MocA family oxidoreductase [Verrucomicrobiales bacterium]MDC0321729.1 Gfo/Idh/MocA family oxidoreductase [Verrucomicrobiales bacterium]